MLNVRRVSCVPTKSGRGLPARSSAPPTFDEIVWNRHDPTLATQQHLRSRAIQIEIASIDADGLRNARTSARQEKQQRPVAPAARRFLIPRVDESIIWVLREMMRHFDVGSFNRDGENALVDAQRRWVVRRHMMGKRSDRRQARIARQDRVLPLLFNLVQKSEN